MKQRFRKTNVKWQCKNYGHDFGELELKRFNVNVCRRCYKIGELHVFSLGTFNLNSYTELMLQARAAISRMMSRVANKWMEVREYEKQSRTRIK